MEGEDPLYPSSIYTAGNDLMRQIHIAMIRLDTKMDGLAHQVNSAQAVYNDRYKDHEERIRMMETRDYVSPATVWKVIGVLLTTVGVAATIIGLVINR